MYSYQNVQMKFRMGQVGLRHGGRFGTTLWAKFVTKQAILHSKLPDPPWLDPVRWRLPGVRPIEPDGWIIRDDVFTRQMALRDDLIAERPREVHALLPAALPAAVECYDAMLVTLQKDSGYEFSTTEVARPDGITVALDRTQPLLTLGRLVQADICIMQEGDHGHVLTGAILCFPAYWTLNEKLGRSLSQIHSPVAEYDSNIERRVQRLFDAMSPTRALLRSNANLHATAELFAPKSETAADARVGLQNGTFVRSERQVLRKLPDTKAIAFTIHTY
ncbi:MAG: DUF3445 domain-containing protein, partial [Pseudomonadota bacterium]